MTRRVIADDREILKIYTGIMRSQDETTANRLKASELLMKLREKDDKDGAEERVVICDDIPKQSAD
ncbi:MAG: hypothetical protein LUD03_05150 [Firmicutes bacterium]|nr:hypothetical protein [Bacillota bacterium]